jgi:hypothetical protein
MATGRKTVVVGQVIDPVTWGNPLWDQSVQQFASDADRTTQFPVGQRKVGAVTWLDDSKVLQVWDGAGWRTLPTTAAPPYQTWTSYTPVWKAGGAPVTLGTGGVCGGIYQKVGQTVDVKITGYAGTGFNGGAAQAPWTWDLPAVGSPQDHFPVFGWLLAPGGSVPLGVAAAHIAAATSVISDGVMGQGNTLVGGFALPPGSLLLLQARYTV